MLHKTNQNMDHMDDHKIKHTDAEISQLLKTVHDQYDEYIKSLKNNDFPGDPDEFPPRK